MSKKRCLLILVRLILLPPVLVALYLFVHFLVLLDLVVNKGELALVVEGEVRGKRFVVQSFIVPRSYVALSMTTFPCGIILPSKPLVWISEAPLGLAGLPWSPCPLRIEDYWPYIFAFGRREPILKDLGFSMIHVRIDVMCKEFSTYCECELPEAWGYGAVPFFRGLDTEDIVKVSFPFCKGSNYEER